jgi:hypothetical protein
MKQHFWNKRRLGLASYMRGKCRKIERDGRCGLDRRHSFVHAHSTDFMEFALLHSADRGLSFWAQGVVE